MAWRDHPYDAEGYLYLLKPKVVFQAQVNMPSVTYPVASITYDNVTTGSDGDIEMGMTLMLGSAPGKWDRGRIYVRGDADHDVADSTTINIGYSARGHNAGEVDLIDNSYITVVDLFEVWKRPSRMLDDGTGSILKDYSLGIAQWQLPITLIAGGLARMDFVDGGGTLSEAFDASGSHLTDPTYSGWASSIWDVKDGTITSGVFSDDAITATFAPGYRWIKHDRVDSHGRRALPRRQLVVALDGVADSNLIQTVGKAQWSLKPEGVTFSAELRQRLDPADYLPGTVVIWLVKERYNGVAGSLTGYEIKFAGYLDYTQSFGQANRTDFERAQTIYALDVAGRLKKLGKAPPSVIARESDPRNGNELTEANISRHLWWTLSWHTSAPMVADFRWDATPDYPFASFSSPGGDYYSVPDNLARGFARRFTCDSRGQLLMPPDPLRLDPSERTSAVLESLGPADITRMERVQTPQPKVGALRASAISTSSQDASSLAEPVPDIYVVAPGPVEGQAVGEDQSGYPWLVRNATEAFMRIGEDYERQNADEGLIRITLAHGGDTGFEPAYLQWVEVTTDDDTLGWMDEPLDHVRCLVVQVDFTYDDQGNTLQQALIVERETFGAPGAFDPIAQGDTPINPTMLITAGLTKGVGTLAVMEDNGHLWTTTNFQDSVPTWTDHDLSGTLGGVVIDFLADPFSPLYLGTGTTVNGWILTPKSIWRIADIFGARTLTAQYTITGGFLGDAFFSFEFERVQQGFGVALYQRLGTPNHMHALATRDGAHWTTDVDLGGTASVAQVHVSSRIAGRAYLFGTNFEQTLDQGATYAPLSTPDVHGNAGYGLHLAYPDTSEQTAYFPVQSGLSNFLYKAVGATQTDISPTVTGNSLGPLTNHGVHTSDLNGAHLVCAAEIYGATRSGAFYSADGGTTWTTLDVQIPVTGVSVIRGCNVAGDDNQTVFFWGRDYLAYSEDPVGAGLANKWGLSGGHLLLNLVGG